MPPLVLLRDCRVCQGRLSTALDLGLLAVSDFPLPGEPLTTAPLDLCRCVSCGLVQLRHTYDRDRLYRGTYWYRSSVNEAMRAELADVVRDALTWVTPGVGQVVIDVGANDGFLLQQYRNGCRTLRVGFEPAGNLSKDLKEHCETLVPDFFTEATARRCGLGGRAAIVTTIAMLYDVDDLHTFVDAVKFVLHPEGVWIIQFQDLAQMLAQTAFDNICHEHLTYPRLEDLVHLVAGAGLVVKDVEPRAINGGSLRVVVQHRADGQGQPRTPTRRVSAQIAREREICTWQALELFAWRVSEVKRILQGTIIELQRRGWTIDLYAASTKANTLLQYCGLDGRLVRRAWERSLEKVGRTTVTGIPIVSEATGRADPPSVLLLGAWQFREAFVVREAAYLEAGGTMLAPLPVVELIAPLRGRTTSEVQG